MGYQKVLQAAKVGQMLIELKTVTPHGEFVQRVEHFVGLKRVTFQNLMTLARNHQLLEQYKPDSQRAALASRRTDTPDGVGDQLATAQTRVPAHPTFALWV